MQRFLFFFRCKSNREKNVMEDYATLDFTKSVFIYQEGFVMKDEGVLVEVIRPKFGGGLS